MASEEAPSTSTAAITVLCPECGDVIEVKDPHALIRFLHLQNSCPLRTLLGASD